VDGRGCGLKEFIPQNFTGWLEKTDSVDIVGVVIEI
jgi:hypothetical protein